MKPLSCDKKVNHFFALHPLHQSKMDSGYEIWNEGSNNEMNGDDFSYDSAAPCSTNVEGLSSVGLACTYSVVSLISILGNSLVIYVVCCMERRKTSTDVYLMNLALANLIFSLTLPFWAVYAHSEWVFGTFMCKLLSGLQETTFYSGVLLLACISIDRYLAIVKATQVVTHKRHLMGAVCIVVWLVAGFLSLPVLVQREAFVPPGEMSLVCYENITSGIDQWRVGMRILRYAVGFFFPLVVMTFCYGCTMCTLYRLRNSQKNKAMRVILCVVLAFVVCWLPYNLTILVDTLMQGRLIEETCKGHEQVIVSIEVTQVLAFLHCAVNPILYAFIGQRFRNQLLTTLFKHGLISKRVLSKYRKGSVYSSTSINTSITR
ncbi:hypothetical protein GN956_G357 [Arapaima gigas]